MKLLCRLGFHRWDVWGADPCWHEGYLVANFKCFYCHKIAVRKIA